MSIEDDRLWLTRSPLSGDPAVRLFCFPYAGGSSGLFRTWPKSLPPDVEVLSLNMPGRQARIAEPPIRDIRTLVDAFGPVAMRYALVPFVLFGYSLGGLVAFEVARYLSRRSISPAALIVAACAAPTASRRTPAISDMPDPQFVAAFREFANLPDDVVDDPHLMRLVLPMLRADVGMAEKYVRADGECLTCRIHTIIGQDDPTTPLAAVTLWKEETLGEVASTTVPGNHGFLHSSPDEVLRVVQRELALARISSASP